MTVDLTDSAVVTIPRAHYAHVIDALESRPKYADLDALIAAARGGEGLRHAQ